MAYSEQLEKRLNKIIAKRKDFHKQKMFGGLGYLMRGNMCFGIFREYLIARIGEETADKVLKDNGVKQFDITGRPMKGWVMVHEETLESDAILKKWIERAVVFVMSISRK